MNKIWNVVNYRHHDLDECKAFNDMVVAERSKVLAKRKLYYRCYESISPNTQHVIVQKEVHVRYASGSIPLVHMVSSTKRKMGQQKIIPKINKSL